MKTIAFLGGGRITSALVAGLRLSGYGGEIVVYVRHPEKLRALRRAARVQIARDVKSAVSRPEMLIVAVRPASVAEMLDEVARCGVAAPTLCVSLAAGVPLRNLRAWLGPGVHWARAMPSPVCRMGRGFTPVCFAPSVRKSERVRVRKFFARLGAVVDLPEGQMDAITAAASPTHGYHALATLAKTARKAGLDGQTALLAAAHALCDGIGYWRESGESLHDLLQEAATPGGIAAATMAAMDASGYARVVESGIRAGVKQARRNGESHGDVPT